MRLHYLKYLNKTIDASNLIHALTTHSSLIKRPVLETEQGYIVGYDEAAYNALK